MTLSRKIVLRLLAAIILFGTTACPPRAHAVEEAAIFLAALRSLGYYDTANDYLEHIKTSPLVSDEFKNSIPYEQALTLVSQASTVDDMRRRELQLKAAVEKFKEFATSQPDHSRTNAVKMQVGGVYVTLARFKLLAADKPDADKEALRKEAREQLTAARTAVAEAEAAIQAARKKLPRPVPPERKDLLELQQQLRTDWVQSELLLAAIAYELSKAYEPGSDEYKKQLADASKEYEELFMKHRVRLAGLYSRVQQMQCLLDRGDFDDVLNCYADLQDQNDKIPQLRNLKIEAARYAVRAQVGLKKYDDGAKAAGLVLSAAEEKTTSGMALNLEVAIANILKADTIKNPALQRVKRSHITKAKSLLKPIANSKSELRMRAQEELAKLGDEAEAPEAPKNFDEAYDLAVRSLQKFPLHKKALAAAPADKQAELQKTLDAEMDKAFANFHLALSFADNDTPESRLATVLKSLCFLYYNQADYMRSAVIGDYLARNYPDSSGAKFGTYIAMNGWLNEYNSAWKDKQFETSKIRELGDRLVDKWPESNEAIEARYRLVILAVQDKQNRDVAAALKYLGGIPEDSARRGKAELTVGQTLWNEYAKTLRLPKDEKPPQAELESMVNGASKVLNDGIKRMEGAGQVDGNIVGAAYALAQLYAGTNQPAKALALIEHKDYGPLTLVEAKSPIAKKGNYELKTYRLALRCYIGALPEFKGREDELLRKAIVVSQKLEAAVAKEENGPERLTQMYIEMGRDLEDQLAGISDPQGRKALSGAFELFLDKIRSSGTGNSFSSLVWIAETYFGLGHSNDTDTGELDKTAESYYQRAAETYAMILNKGKQDPKFVKPRQKATIQLRMVDCYRKLGKFDDAKEMLVAMLRKKATNLTVQIAAAEMLFEAGTVDCDNYVKSIKGDVPEGKGKIIWGWQRIGDMTAKEERFERYFFQSKLYSIKCRFGLALCLQETKPESSERLLKAAYDTLIGFYQQYPELGGEEFKPQFERMLKKIQIEMGEEATGLASLK